MDTKKELLWKVRNNDTEEELLWKVRYNGYAGFFKSKNGDINFGYFCSSEISPNDGFFVRFFEEEKFVGILKKIHVRGF